MTDAHTDPRQRASVREDVIEAAAELLRRDGARGLTTRAVAESAGIQAPTLYRLFGDKEGLLDAVAEHVMATYVAVKAEEVADEADLAPLEALRAGWRAHVEFGLANPDLFGLLTAPGRAQTSRATAAGAQVLAARVRRLAAAGLLRVTEARAVDVIGAAGIGAVLSLLARPVEGRDLGLADAMFDAACREVLADAPAAPAADALSVTVAFAAVAPDLPGLSAPERALLTHWLDRAVAGLQEPGHD